ncbi:MAG: Rpp14/Pop5 family protein [Candidatus Micrarchaeota archaeon]
MTKARALKKRYILFEFHGRETDEEALKRSLYAEALRFFGEFGLSCAAVKLVSYDVKSKKGILRCERDYLERVLGFLALLGSLEGAEARLVALKSSGTLKSLELDSTQSR